MSLTKRERERRCIFRDCDTDTSDVVRWKYLTLALKKQLSQAREEFDVHDDVDGHDDLALFICVKHGAYLDKIIFKNGARSDQSLVTNESPSSVFLFVIPNQTSILACCALHDSSSIPSFSRSVDLLLLPHCACARAGFDRGLLPATATELAPRPRRAPERMGAAVSTSSSAATGGRVRGRRKSKKRKRHSKDEEDEDGQDEEEEDEEGDDEEDQGEEDDEEEEDEDDGAFDIAIGGEDVDKSAATLLALGSLPISPSSSSSSSSSSASASAATASAAYWASQFVSDPDSGSDGGGSGGDSDASGPQQRRPRRATASDRNRAQTQSRSSHRFGDGVAHRVKTAQVWGLFVFVADCLGF